MATKKILETATNNNPQCGNGDSPDACLPAKFQSWIKGGPKAIRVDQASHRSLKKEIQNVRDQGPWKWPKRRVFFFSSLR